MESFEMRVLRESEAARRDVASIVSAAADYYMTVQGTPAPPEEIDEFFTAVPPGYALEDMFPLGFYAAGQVVGIGGLLKGWNAPNKAMIGLLVLDPAARGKGYGQLAVQLIEEMARSLPGIERLRVGVVACNTNALGFWRRMGYADTGEVKPRFAPFLDDVVILEKPL